MLTLSRVENDNVWCYATYCNVHTVTHVHMHIRSYLKVFILTTQCLTYVKTKTITSFQTPVYLYHEIVTRIRLSPILSGRSPTVNFFFRRITQRISYTIPLSNLYDHSNLSVFILSLTQPFSCALKLIKDGPKRRTGTVRTDVLEPVQRSVETRVIGVDILFLVLLKVISDDLLHFFFYICRQSYYGPCTTRKSYIDPGNPLIGSSITEYRSIVII